MEREGDGTQERSSRGIKVGSRVLRAAVLHFKPQGGTLVFHGTWKEAFVSFLIGMLIKTVSFLLEKREWNVFFTNALSAGLAAVAALGFQYMDHGINSDIVIISSIMLLVPGLAITNAVRDTMAGDYLSGVARATEAFLIAVAIAVGIGFVLSMSIRLKGGL